MDLICPSSIQVRKIGASLSRHFKRTIELITNYSKNNPILQIPLPISLHSILIPIILSYTASTTIQISRTSPFLPSPPSNLRPHISPPFPPFPFPSSRTSTRNLFLEKNENEDRDNVSVHSTNKTPSYLQSSSRGCMLTLTLTASTRTIPFSDLLPIEEQLF